MTDSIMDTIIGDTSLKYHGEHAQFGAWKANQRTHKQYLRANHLCKFRKGKK